MIELVLFDCDGVLIDSEWISARVFAESLAEIGVDLTPHQVVAEFVGLDNASILAKVERDHGIALPREFDGRAAERLSAAFEAELRPLPGAIDALDGLHCAYCVASNSGHKRLRHTLRVAGLLDRFDGRIFSSEDVARGKPAPDLFLHAAATFGRDPSECIVIEDSITGVTAARAANMRVIGFCGAGHIVPGHDARLKAAGAETIIHDFSELLPLLKAFQPV